jgi:hypothetical protein
MSVFAVDPDTGELLRPSGTSFVRIDGPEEAAQGVRIRWRLIRGEVFLDVLAGPQYVGLALAKGTPPQRIEAELAGEALTVPGIVSVDEIDVQPDYANRTAVVTSSMTYLSADQRTRVRIDDRVTLRTE